MMNLLKKSANNTKTAVQMTKGQKPTTTVANISSKVKTAAFGVATGAGVAGTMMMQNERNIRNRKARAEYHKKVEAVCTVAVGAAVVGAGAAIVQGIFDPVIDVSTFEIEPEAYLELNNKASELDAAETDSDSEEPAEEVETVEAEIVPEHEAAAPASAPKAAEKPIVEATATEVQTPDPKDGQPASADPAPVAPQAEQPVAPAPAAPAEKPADSAAATQTNQGNNAQDAKSQTSDQKPKDNGQGASNNNPKNGNNHAKAAK